jgi:squalene synthase HpnD
VGGVSALGAARADLAEVERIVRRAGTSFYRGMRVLPRDRRAAMYAIYAFCRLVDDVADEPAALSDKLAGLAEWRRRVDALYEGKASDAVTRVLLKAVQRYNLRREDFLAVIDGMQMDAATAIVAPDLATLDLYCDRVAAAVGRLSVRAFGDASADADQVAWHLGRALQLTNILRDVDEDAAIGRLYLPREYLQEMDCCRSLDVTAIVHKPAIDTVCRKVAKLAHHHYDEAQRILSARPKGRIKTPRLMGAVYSEILRASEAQGFAAPRHRVSLRKSRLMSLVLRQGIFS